MKARQPEVVVPPLLDFDGPKTWRQEPPHTPLAGLHGPTYVHPPKQAIGRAIRPYPTRAMLGIVLILGFVVAVACWNAVMDEDRYMVQKWNQFIAA